MSAAAELMERLGRLDVRFSLDGERLNCNAPKGALTPELRAELGQHKEAIKLLLRQAASAAALSEEIPKLPRGGPLPVSHSQQRVWFLRQMDPDSTAYNVAGALELIGKLDGDALERAISTIMTRHEIVRSRFVSVDGEPQCFIEEHLPFRLRRFDVSHLPPEQRAARAFERANTVGRELFDLAKAPLVRAELIRVQPDEHILCVVVDHIIADGWSIGVFMREFGALYEAETRGVRLALPPPAVQFVDYAAWHRQWLERGVLATQLPFWQKALGPSLPVLQLPSERPRPKLQTHNGARVMDTWSLDFVESLKAFAREEGITFYMFLLTAFKVLLARYTSADDIVVGTATANRVRPDTEGMIGFCANNIVLRTDLSGNPTVRELLKRVRDMALNAYSNQDVPFDVLVEVLHPRRELDRPPMFQTMLNLQPYPGFRLPGLEARRDRPRPRHGAAGRGRRHLRDAEAFQRLLRVQHGPVRRRIHHAHGRPLSPAAGSVPRASRGADRRSADARRRRARNVARPMESPARAVLREAVRARMDCRAGPAHARCRGRALRGRSLSYREFNARANQLARHLRRSASARRSRVGVWLDRSVDMVVALLGVLKAGGAYVPLDPAFPPDRIAFMFQDAGMMAVVTQERLRRAHWRGASPSAVRSMPTPR